MQLRDRRVERDVRRAREIILAVATVKLHRDGLGRRVEPTEPRPVAESADVVDGATYASRQTGDNFPLEARGEAAALAGG